MEKSTQVHAPRDLASAFRPLWMLRLQDQLYERIRGIPTTLNEYGFVGGGYLRYGYLIALALGLVTLHARWLATSGALFAIATGWGRAKAK